MGWFYGCKLHLVINDSGELVNVPTTLGKTDDRDPVECMTRGLTGTICCDKGYISKYLHNQLSKRNVKLITNVSKNMKNTFKSVYDTFCSESAASSIIHTSNTQDTEASRILWSM